MIFKSSMTYCQKKKTSMKYSAHSNAMNIIVILSDKLSNKKRTCLLLHCEQRLQHHHRHKMPFHFPNIGNQKLEN